jgi:beta-galactosidase/beta-glucuronidase
MKKVIAIWVLIVFATNLSAQILSADKGIKSVSDKSLLVSLNGSWKFQFIPNADWSRYSDFFQEGYNDNNWGKIPVPGNWDALGYTLPKYAHPDDLNGLYRTSFIVPDNWKGQHVILKFDGVLRGYELWVNGHYAGKWESAYNSCQFDVTEFLKDGENLLAVRVYTRFKGFDFDGNDDWGQVGITRDVTMFPVPDTHIKDLTITTRLVDQKAIVGLDFEVSNFSQEDAKNLLIKGEMRAEKCSRTKIKVGKGGENRSESKSDVREGGKNYSDTKIDIGKRVQNYFKTKNAAGKRAQNCFRNKNQCWEGRRKLLIYCCQS